MFEYYDCNNKITKNRYLQMHQILKDDYINRHGLDHYNNNFNKDSFDKWVNMIINDKNYNIIIYIIDNVVVGFVCYMETNNNLCICEVQIKKEYQGKFNIFRKLMEELIIYNKKYEKLILTIDKDNYKSINVFSHIGLVNTNKNWYEIDYNLFIKWCKKQ